jgi:hypothetical protein
MSWLVSLLLLVVAALLWFGGAASSDDVFGMLAKIIGTVLALVVLIFGHQLPLELLGLGLALSLPAARSFQSRSQGLQGSALRKPSRWSVFAD